MPYVGGSERVRISLHDLRKYFAPLLDMIIFFPSVYKEEDVGTQDSAWEEANDCFLFDKYTLAFLTLKHKMPRAL